MNTNVIRLSLSLTTILGTAVIATAASGVTDDKILHGSVCGPAFGGADNVGNNRTTDGFFNGSDDGFEDFVTCPIERDVTNDTDGIGFLKVRV